MYYSLYYILYVLNILNIKKVTYYIKNTFHMYFEKKL